MEKFVGRWRKVEVTKCEGEELLKELDRRINECRKELARLTKWFEELHVVSEKEEAIENLLKKLGKTASKPQIITTRTVKLVINPPFSILTQIVENRIDKVTKKMQKLLTLRKELEPLAELGVKATIFWDENQPTIVLETR